MLSPFIWTGDDLEIICIPAKNWKITVKHLVNSEPNTSIELKYPFGPAVSAESAGRKEQRTSEDYEVTITQLKRCHTAAADKTQKEKDNIIPNFTLSSHSAYKLLFSTLLLTLGKDAESSVEETEHMDTWYQTCCVLVTIVMFPTLNMQLHACSWDLPLGRKCSIGIKYHNYSGFNNTISLSFKVFIYLGYWLHSLLLLLL